MDSVSTLARHVRDELGKAIIGQDDLKRDCLAVLLCEGHALLEGVPGIAKTLTVKALARLVGLEFQRVQCTSDLMPADIVGTNVASLSTGTFQLHRGPAFTDLLLVDEVNRMPPRTQAALLECMEERQITIDGVRHELSPGFTVFATQNPIDFEGTYPLPEAQLDRFLAKIRVPYPSAQDEVALLTNVQRGYDSQHLDGLGIAPIPAGLLDQARADVKHITVQDALFGYITTLVRTTRDWPALSLGASPRAAVSLMRFSKALAAMEGRDFLLPDDVKSAFATVLRHRIVVKAEADLEGLTADQVLADVSRSVEMPR
jgi:MoxR-like ATPase